MTVFAMVFMHASVPRTAHAETLQSSNYQFSESSIGTGGLLESSSANFTSNGSTGDLSVGEANSANFSAIAGSHTTHDPVLACIIGSSNADFGIFSASGASTATATFSVLNYTSYGYVVQITGDPPTNGAHSLPGMTTTSPSQPGIEQFGVNLVANTSPTSFGANLDNGGFGFGQIAPNYATSNQFRYVEGETIALAPKSSGITNYTLSYIANVANLTPGGRYSSNQTLIVTGTY